MMKKYTYSFPINEQHRDLGKIEQQKLMRMGKIKKKKNVFRDLKYEDGP